MIQTATKHIDMGTPIAVAANGPKSCSISPMAPHEPASPGQPHSRAYSPDQLDALSKSIVRKYDIRLIPTVFTAYTVFWLDRSNIALARVNGLEADLRLRAAEFNASLAVFFAAYVVFNIPANLVMRRLGGGRFLPALVVAWGLATLGSGFVGDFAGLCASRAVVGLAEAGFMGGVLLWLGFFYTNEEIISRVGIFLSSTPLAGSLGGLLAGGLSRIDSGGYSRWPWIFFIEGALTVVVGIAAFFIMPNSPQTASFLTPEERIAAKDRMVLLDRRSFARRIACISSKDSSTADIDLNQRYHDNTTLSKSITATDVNTVDKLHRSVWRRAILHPITVFMTVGCFLTIESIYAFNLFIPSLLLEMGYRGLSNSLMTAPPNFFAFLYTIAATQYSQRTNRIAIPLILSSAMSTLGFVFLLLGSYAGGVEGDDTPRIVRGLQYAGMFFIGGGVSSATPLAMSWVCINANPHYVRAIVLGFMLAIGNLASFVASFVYVKTNAPRYTVGHSINTVFNFSLLLMNFCALAWMKRENRAREQGLRDGRLEKPAEGMTREEYEMHLGWDHPRFRFHL